MEKSYFSETLCQSEDWIWDWIKNYHCREKSPELIQWFEQCTSGEIKKFWAVYFDELFGSLPPNYLGIKVVDKDGDSFYLSEDSQADFNEWIILQGKEIWKLAAIEQEKRGEPINESYDGRGFSDLFNIMCETDANVRNNIPIESRTWQGHTWLPRTGHFPGLGADLIFEERFNQLIWE